MNKKILFFFLIAFSFFVSYSAAAESSRLNQWIKYGKNIGEGALVGLLLGAASNYIFTLKLDYETLMASVSGGLLFGFIGSLSKLESQ
jgi:hypothetical protein